MKVAQLRLTLIVHGILQARILEWMDSLSLLQMIYPTQGSNQGLPHGRLYRLSHRGSPKISPAQKLPSVLHESESVSHSVVPDSLQPYGLYPPGPYVHGSLQARILEWVAIPFSRGSSQSRD